MTYMYQSITIIDCGDFSRQKGHRTESKPVLHWERGSRLRIVKDR